MINLAKYDNDEGQARRTMSAFKAFSSGIPRGLLRCVERCWPITEQARRSDTFRFS